MPTARHHAGRSPQHVKPSLAGARDGEPSQRVNANRPHAAPERPRASEDMQTLDVYSVAVLVYVPIDHDKHRS